MKLLALLLLLPMFTFAQEMPIGVRVSDSWVFSTQAVSAAQSVLDSVDSGKFIVDSLSYQSDSATNVHFHSTASIVYADIIVVQYRDDTLWTTPDPEMYKCYNSCVALYECGGCFKSSSCGCVCSLNGLCESQNLGMAISLSELIRNKLIYE